MMTMKRSVFALAAALAAAASVSAAADRDNAVPRYAHVFVIVEENKDYAQILDPAAAPNIARLARTYGDASQFFAEVHPSEGNYVALLGGDTFGIHDDDAFYCKPGMDDPRCAGAKGAGYQDHTSSKPHLGDQLLKAGLTWKGYYESLPEPGSLAVTASDPAYDNGTRKTALYASKHSGFVNFASTQKASDRAEHLVGFDRLYADIAGDRLPSFALIVPNQCNEMHGLSGANIPADCQSGNRAGLIARGDRVVGDLVARLQATKAWASDDNMAIVITFDEGAGRTREGCCAVTPEAISNFGGGHIPTVVITNHGPHGLNDPTPYNHYSLLRTLEDAFRLPEHLGHAADEDKGVVAMAPLFAEAKKAPARVSSAK
jgi:phosphatidylinositol-3-phosphatase